MSPDCIFPKSEEILIEIIITLLGSKSAFGLHAIQKKRLTEVWKCAHNYIYEIFYNNSL